MFSLIISIIAIALVAALAGASVYYGGSAFNKGTAGADASTFVNAGQQIQGAFTLASTDGYSPSTLVSLSDSSLDGDNTNDKDVYLSQVPSYKGVVPTLTGDYISVPVSAQVVEEMVDNRNAAELTTAAATPTGELLAVNSTDNVAFYKVK